jgi:DNA-binding HxlR family transcriptional regulator
MAQVNSKQTAIKEVAKKYVDEQLQVLKKHGSVNRVSKNEYNSIVNQVVRASAK